MEMTLLSPPRWSSTTEIALVSVFLRVRIGTVIDATIGYCNAYSTPEYIILAWIHNEAWMHTSAQNEVQPGPLRLTLACAVSPSLCH